MAGHPYLLRDAKQDVIAVDTVIKRIMVKSLFFIINVFVIKRFILPVIFTKVILKICCR